jgi:hypothetical protein
MRIRGWRRVRRRWRRVTSAFQRQAIILLYHRVAEAACDPQLLCVSPRHFEEHLEYLHRHFRPTVLLALQRMLEAGRITPKTVTITFDDGYADNLRYAKPRLEVCPKPSGYVSTGVSITGNWLKRRTIRSTTTGDIATGMWRETMTPLRANISIVHSVSCCTR